MAFISLGNAIVVNAGPTVTVTNVATTTNTFRFVNSNTSAYSYAGVYSTYAEAAAMHHPVAGGLSGQASILIGNWPEVIQGNFGPSAITNSTVYVATITAVSSPVATVIQPVRSVE